MEADRVIKKCLGVIAGIAIAAVGADDHIHDAHFRKIGKPAVAQAIDSYTKHGYKTHNTDYRATIRFTTEDRMRVAVEKSFPYEILAEFQAQRPVVVLYDPDNMNDFIFEKAEPEVQLLALGIGLALYMLLLG